jgi:hypothetical protein
MSSFRPLIKHILKKASDMPSVLKAKCSKSVIKSSIMQTVSTWSSDPNGVCRCQSIHKDLQQTVSKQHTFGVNFYAIAIVASV